MLVSLQSHTEVLNTLDSYPEVRAFEHLLHSEEGKKKNCSGSCNGTSTCKRPRDIPDDGKIFVASVSPQVRASIAATYGISQRDAGYLIEQFLSGPRGLRAGGKHGSGFTWVVDTNVMRQAVLELTDAEVSEALGKTEPAVPTDAEFPTPSRPILSSACPGWICYAEKTHPHVLPHLSRLKSPQALTGTLLKTVLSRKLHVPPSQIWHLAIMPCFDKKLEASRQELTHFSWQSPSQEQEPVRDVDCVITSRELLTLASSRNITLPSLPLKPVPTSHTTPFPDPILSSFLFPPSRHSTSYYTSQPSASGPSGGYLHHLLTTNQALNPGSIIHSHRGRNADVIEFSLTSPQGDPILKAARYYGFRNIQNLVRKLKPVRASKLPGARPVTSRRAGAATAGASGAITEYAYVEVMACPGGCTNGGGQIRVEDAREAAQTASSSSPEEQSAPQKPTPQEQRAWLARVDEAYYSAESEDEDTVMVSSKQQKIEQKQPDIRTILSHWSSVTDIPLSKLVYTTFRKVESDVGKSKDTDTARVAELAGKVGGGW